MNPLTALAMGLTLTSTGGAAKSAPPAPPVRYLLDAQGTIILDAAGNPITITS